MSCQPLPIATANVATMDAAERHFAIGGQVVVSECGAPELPIYGSTVVHDATTTTWDELVLATNVWSNRYPNQRWFLIPTGEGEGAGDPPDDVDDEDLTALLQSALVELAANECDDRERLAADYPAVAALAEVLEQYGTFETFAEAMVLTSNQGLVVTTEAGSAFQVTVVQSA